MIRQLFLRLRAHPPAWLFLALAVAATVATSAEAQKNDIERVTVASEGRDRVTFDVVYSYSGDQGGNVSISVVMAQNDKPSAYFAYKPARVQPGRRRTQVELGVSRSAPDVFSSNQIHVAMYVGGNTFVKRSFFFPKTWSRPGGTLQPVLQIIGTAILSPGTRPPATLTADSRGGGAPVRYILANGHVELRYPDGTVRERYPGGETVTSPDGSTQTLLFASAQPPTPPSAPPDMAHARWLDAENDRLLDIIRTLVGNHEPSVQRYLSQEGSGISPYRQVGSRTRVIDMLVRP